MLLKGLKSNKHHSWSNIIRSRKIRHFTQLIHTKYMHVQIRCARALQKEEYRIHMPKTYNEIVHVDPAVGTSNLGDFIISEAVSKSLDLIFPDARRSVVSSRDMGQVSLNKVTEADYAFFGGTNALSANPLFGYRQFSTSRNSAIQLRNMTLLGVGWWQYQGKSNFLTRRFYQRMLRNDVMHSVRDEYTRKKLDEMGISNALNTGCPTMWELSSFTKEIGSTAVFTLTDYHPNLERDGSFLRSMLKKFEKAFFWPQGAGDVAYLSRLTNDIDAERIEILPPSIRSLDAAFRSGACYVGTRLHAGIRALQNRAPSYIIAIDNRALEMSRSDSLHLTKPTLTDIHLGAQFEFEYTPRSEVQEFLAQFQR